MPSLKGGEVKDEKKKKKKKKKKRHTAEVPGYARAAVTGWCKKK
jgi:hypothetical protein